MNETPTYWPSDDDQAVIDSLCVEYPLLGPGMCYLYGAYRQRGYGRDKALAYVYQDTRAQMQAMQKEQP